MAGHSKWSNIRFRKGRQDALKAKLFTKISKEILVAGKSGPDPDTNFKLRIALQKAKSASMPRANIERLLKKVAGVQDGQDFLELTYEGYAAQGVAMIVEAVTDNKFRTAAAIRHLFKKHGGNLGQEGCVSWMFESKGEVLCSDLDSDGQVIGPERAFDYAIECGADEVEVLAGQLQFLVAPEKLSDLRESLEQAQLTIQDQGLTMVTDSSVPVVMPEAKQVVELFSALDEHDDVQKVYANFDIEQGLLEELIL